MSLAVKTTKGVFWSGSSQAAKQLLQVVITAILARLLSPADFGLIGMVIVITGFLNIFSELGLGSALIQRKDLTDEHISTAFSASVLSSLALMLITVISAPALALLYKNASLVPITIALALNFPLGALGVVQLNLLQRELDFRKVAVIENGALIASGIGAVWLAVNGFGVWSLVAQALIGSVVGSLLAWTLTRNRPRWLFRRERFNELFQFSANVVGSQMLSYVSRNLDNLLIGRFLGASALGYYSLAYRLMMSPLANVSRVLGRVLFPAFSQLQHDLPKVRGGYLQTIRLISLATFPMMAGLAVVTPELVRVVYGPQWERSIFLIRVLCLVGALQSIGTTIGPVCLSQGRSDVLFKWSLFSVPIVCLAIIIGLRWDIEGVALSYASVSLSLWYASHYITNRLIELKMKRFMLALVPTALAAAVMAAILTTIRLTMGEAIRWSNWQLLLVEVSLGAAIYFLVLLLARAELIREIVAIAKQLGQRTPNWERGEL